MFAGAGFFLLYLPWGFSPRTLNFSHYLFEAIPYACLALGMLLDRAVGRPRAWRFAAWGYAAVGRACSSSSSCRSSPRCPVPSALWGFRFPGGGGLWTWFPSWI